jgi:DNA primase
MITRECLDYIKDMVDICDVVAPYVNLKKCGANWRGLSPFNSEKTPSFFVMPSKKIFKCFSSGNAGDIFRFIQLKENVSFSEAAEIIANRFNITLRFDSQGAENRASEFSKNDLFAINELANEVFTKNLQKSDDLGQKVRDYWVKTREFSLETAIKHGIGICKNDEKFLIDSFAASKLPLSAIRQSGLFYSNEDSSDPGTFKLRFRFRLTIPIRDIQGRIAGFSARAIDGITAKLSDAKYINSPETPIFRKGSMLFGLHEARLHIGEASQFWLVEGQLDVFRCWEAGLLTAVAPQGTAITETQLSTLRRYASNLNCLFDGDDAGMRAADKLLHMAMGIGLETKFYILSKGEDPDSFFKKIDKSQLEAFHKSGLSAMEFATRYHIPTPSKISGQRKADALQKIYEIVAASDSSIVHESLLEEVSQICGFNRRALSQDFATFFQRKKFNNPLPIKFSVEGQSAESTKFDSAESQLLAIVLSDDGLGREIGKIFAPELLLPSSSPEAALLAKILNEIAENMWEGIETIDDLSIFSEEERNIAYSALANFTSLSSDGDIRYLANLCLSKLNLKFFRKKISELDVKISKISLDEKEMIRNLQRDRLCLREKSSKPPQVDLI